MWQLPSLTPIVLNRTDGASCRRTSLACARKLAPELAYPVPKGSLGEVVGLDGQPRALFTFNKRRVDSEVLTKHLVADDDFGTDMSRAAVLPYLERCIPWGG